MISRQLLNSPHLKMVLTHEKSHISQWHSLDVIFTELMTVFFFYNPFIYLMKREVRINLEYLADESCVENHHQHQHKDYQRAILQVAINQPYVKISNHFNYSPIKKRIMMLNKKNSEKRAMLKYMSILPMVCGLLLLSQCTEQKTTDIEADKLENQQENKVIQLDKNNVLQYAVVEEKPEFEGGFKGVNKYIAENIKYPKEAVDNGIEGIFFIDFVINQEGEVEQVKTRRAGGKMINKSYSLDTLSWGINKGKAILYEKKGEESIPKEGVKEVQSALLLEKEAKRVILSMPKWKPAKQKGQPVDVEFMIPINFKLAKD